MVVFLASHTVTYRDICYFWNNLFGCIDPETYCLVYISIYLIYSEVLSVIRGASVIAWSIVFEQLYH